MSRTPWHHAIDPADWAEMTRMHESAHVVASEALRIPVDDVWVNVDRDVAHGGQYRNASADSQLQTVVYLIGAEGGAQELRERGYPEELVEHSIISLGYNDRAQVADVIAEAAAGGYQLDGQRAHHDAQAVLHSDGFIDTARTVAQALADRGDRLTGTDVRVAMGGWELDSDLWVPAWNQLPSRQQDLSRADDDAEMEIDL